MLCEEQIERDRATTGMKNENRLVLVILADWNDEQVPRVTVDLSVNEFSEVGKFGSFPLSLFR